jgi:hypothetical protein
MIIESAIFRNPKGTTVNRQVSVELYPAAARLYNLLDSADYIARLKSIELLGSLDKKNKLKYSRFDYIVLQLYMQKLVQKELPEDLLYSFRNQVRQVDFSDSALPLIKAHSEDKHSVGELLQILAITSNIGHFRNTFTASRAAIKVLYNDHYFRARFMKQFRYEKHIELAEKIIAEQNYYRYHLINALLILQTLDQEESAVVTAMHAICESLLPAAVRGEKLKETYQIFKDIRDLSFMACDLLVAPIPLYIDLKNETQLSRLLQQIVAKYAEKQQVQAFLKGMNKMLHDLVYNEAVQSIEQYCIASKMAKKLTNEQVLLERFQSSCMSFITDSEGDGAIFNQRHYKPSSTFDTRNILCLNMPGDLSNEVINLCSRLEKMNFVRAAWYYRIGEKQITLLVSLKKGCKNRTKHALKVLKHITNFINHNRKALAGTPEIVTISALLTAKFFLYYLFLEQRIEINGTLDTQIAAILERGKNRRTAALSALINNNKYAEAAKIHEVVALRNILQTENINDSTIILPSSIKVYANEGTNTCVAEFDGLIIFPNRSKDQVVFLEAKDRKRKSKEAVNCLHGRLQKFGIHCDKEEIYLEVKDSFYRHTILLHFK